MDRDAETPLGLKGRPWCALRVYMCSHKNEFETRQEMRIFLICRISFKWKASVSMEIS